MKFRSLIAFAIVVSVCSYQPTEVKAGVHVNIGSFGVSAGRGYLYTPYSYPVVHPAYAPPPVLITTQRYPYYAVPQPVARQTYYVPSPVYSQPVVYSPPVLYAPAPVVGGYYYPRLARGHYTYKVKYRRGFFHDYVKYKIEYND